MIPVFETFGLVPSKSTGRWIAVFQFEYDGQYFEYPYFSDALDLNLAPPDSKRERMQFLDHAQLRFLEEVNLTGELRH